jgi:hypothetical protein
MGASCKVTYTGATPGADANTYVLFSTAVAFPGANYLAETGFKRLQLGLSNSQAGTLNWYKSQTRLTSTSLTPVWTQIGTLAVAAGATAENDVDFLVEEYADFKLEWVNGGVAQATWLVDMALTDERNKST